MKKKFNVTGLCIPNKHYVADVSKKLGKTYKMVVEGDYFIINRPRQYGKTTMLYNLSESLSKSEEYMVFNISFEGIGDDIFKEEAVFSEGFVDILATYAEYKIPSLASWLHESKNAVNSLKSLSSLITKLVIKADKKIVLLIDEVDKSSNNQLFVSFLAMLRNKFLSREDFKTFHSVVLAGLHDVKSLKLKLRPDEESKYNSPWNIASAFTVDMNLQPEEIKSMLDEYAADKGVEMDTQEIANKLFYYTSGYPFLVSSLCKIYDEEILLTKTNLQWTAEDVDASVVKITKESNTNFESLIKNLEENSELYALVFRQLIEVEILQYSIFDPVIQLGLMHGVLKNGKGIAVHNKIYEEIIYDYMLSKTSSKISLQNYNVNKGYRLPNSEFNIELVLLKFQAFMRDQYSQKDRDFLEKNGRLVFLAFIKPIINGSGYDFKEVQISEERRLDVVITYFNHKYVAELKIWRGQAAHEEGLNQLSDYLNRQALKVGYLLIFDHANTKTWTSEWIDWQDKKIFVVWV
jgi:hypothetical protein